jgi:DNA-binding HxlR family transcriptional regulator
MSPELRSDCPIAASLDVLGDRWTLVVLRDILLDQRCSFTEIGSNEGIATNILADRLDRLVAACVLERHRDPEDGRRKIYVPTDRGIELIPVLVDLVVWGNAHTEAKGVADLAAAIRSDRDAVIEQLVTRARQGVVTQDT